MAQINFWGSQGIHSLLSPCWLALTCIRARVHIAFSSGRKALAVHRGESRQPPLYDRWSTLAFCGLPPLFLMAEHQSIIAKGREKGRAMVTSPEPFLNNSKPIWLTAKKRCCSRRSLLIGNDGKEKTKKKTHCGALSPVISLLLALFRSPLALQLHSQLNTPLCSLCLVLSGLHTAGFHF